MTKPTTLFIGPFPPPRHGQSFVTEHLAKLLEDNGKTLKRIDTGEGNSTGIYGTVLRVSRHLLAACALLTGSGTAYISANSNYGIWATALLAGIGRLRGRRLVIHHHSYARFRARDIAMIVLARSAGPLSVHCVLCKTMAQDLKRHVPEVHNTHQLNNSPMVLQQLRDVSRPRKIGLITIGHLSNLTIDKGIKDFVDSAIHLSREVKDARFIVAGPAAEPDAEYQLQRAKSELGHRFEYRGPVYGDDKIRFFRDIDIFLFPTRYQNEAQPLVVFEALASGVQCVATDCSCIAEDIGDAGYLLKKNQLEPSSIAAVLKTAVYALEKDPDEFARRARIRYDTKVKEAKKQLDGLVEVLAE